MGMGISMTLLEKAPLELSIEVDNEILIEISTGFRGPNCGQSVSSLPITKDELASLIDKLIKVQQELLESWVCEDCKTINNKEYKQCQTCR